MSANDKSVVESLRAAIQKRVPVSFEYTKAPGLRIGNPHALFVLRRKDGTETTKIDIEQTDGFSESGGPFPSWRRFDLEKIRLIQIHDDCSPFELSQVYNPTAPVYELSIAKV